MTEKTFCEECRNDVEYTTAFLLCFPLLLIPDNRDPQERDDV